MEEERERERDEWDFVDDQDTPHTRFLFIPGRGTRMRRRMRD